MKLIVTENDELYTIFYQQSHFGFWVFLDGVLSLDDISGQLCKDFQPPPLLEDHPTW